MACLRSVLVFCAAAVLGLFTGYASAGCGEVIHLPANGGNVIITSPNFPNPYPDNKNCAWRVYAPAGSCIQADALFWGLSTTGYTFVVLSDKGTESAQPLTQAYNYGQPAPLAWRSRTSILEIGFKSLQGSNGQGFQLALRAKPCNTACVERQPPKYTISLDVPAEERWRHVVADFPFLNISTLGMLNVFEYFSQDKWYPFTGNFNETRKAMVLDYHSKLPAEQRGELTGIAKYTGIPLEFIVMANVIYETVTGCTSIVASDALGRPIHGRNLDFRGTPGLRDDTIHVDVVRDGKVLYSVVTFAGSISFMTVHKPRKWTMSLNRRIVNPDPMPNLQTFLNPEHTVLLKVVREALETADSYDEAVAMFSEALLPSPCYLIIGGMRENEGVVLTRGREGPVDVYPINVPFGQWYVVQTNSDRGTPYVPGTDHFSPYDRQKFAEEALNATGRPNMDFRKMMDVTKTKGVYNVATVFSTVMGASNPEAMNTIVRCPLPLSPPAAP
ncbi:hypothetical protein RvY_04373 [Ramazzottius varieornatus]|uniref:CUB domain-containing protein n=1 Tax=Ramazzottius varieornatus TaxID=947166 RepID=A0A1D1UX58_RAMVA|nr:hypothetical protein RvY_04373 [Ramazzottius varieornatus]